MTTIYHRFACLTLLLLCCLVSLHGQSNISGIINQYTSVTAIDYTSNSVTVGNPGFFAVGEEALLIQMQGATIDESNADSFGDITAMGGAGNYEIAVVCSIDGNTIILEHTLINQDYDPTGQLQLITMPTFADATVNAELTGEAWNGSTGGVVALSVTGTLTLDAPINMDGKGFRGGDFENAVSNCTWVIPVLDYFYDTPNDGGGKKGESVTAYINDKEYGRGPQAGGGGGGNDHNSGGGGGANAGAGGVGGENLSTGFFNCSGRFPGEGGKVPLLSDTRIFMGSGGGAGEGNNNAGTSGGAGGGIILIFANTVTTGAGMLISANGISAANTSAGDGGGGGGAGGSIYLEASSAPNTLMLSVNGGKGGDVDNEGVSRCFGPGGGGGGGLIRTNAALPATNINLEGGLSGESDNTSFATCTGQTGSSPGSPGVLLNETIPRGTTLAPACMSLPVSWQALHLELRPKATVVSWSLSDQSDNDYFTVERSRDGRRFTALAQIPAGEEMEYAVTDEEPLAGHSFYRVRQTDVDGSYSFSPIATSQRPSATIQLIPNLARAGETVRLSVPELLQGDNTTINLIDGSGRELWKRSLTNGDTHELNTTNLPKGLYFVHLQNERTSWTGRLFVTH